MRFLPSSGGADTPVHDKPDQDVCRGYQGFPRKRMSGIGGRVICVLDIEIAGTPFGAMEDQRR